MSIKDAILGEIKERVRERIKSVDISKKQADYVWFHTSQIENDRYDKGVADANKNELDFLYKLLEFLKSL